MRDKEDYCTWFPEKWQGIDISDCCSDHDDSCSTHIFYECLKEKFKNIKFAKLHASFIALGGGLGCLAKYPHKMFKRI